MNQSFNIKELRRVCKQEEYIKFGLSVSGLETQLNSVCENISNESFDFEIKQVGSFFLSESLSDKLILRKLNDNIKRIYKDEQANRKVIISQIKILLESTCPYWIIKTDIKSFYESIKADRLITKFRDESMLSYYSIFLLNKLFSSDALLSSTGVPKGMNISATLSEIYMRKFDKWIRNYTGVFYYARFVDDIVVFSNSLQETLNLLQELDVKLGELADGLAVNVNKTQLFNGLTLEQLDGASGTSVRDGSCFEYLGYKFTKIQERRIINLKTNIADKKVKKIKTRIALSFMDFMKSRDFELLNKRIRFLTGNYGIKKSTKGNTLKAGIYFNYSHLTDVDQLKQLTDYYRKILYCKKGKLGIALTRLSLEERKKLKKYCFVEGFDKKTYNPFSYLQMAEIVKCW